MDKLQELANRLEDLGDDDVFRGEEKAALERHFGRKIEFARLRWVVFNDDMDGKYKRYFSLKDEEFMMSLYERKIERFHDFAKKIDECPSVEKAMEICAQAMLDYAKSWEKIETHSLEAERTKRNMMSIGKVEVRCGRLVKENCPNYLALVVETKNGGYCGSIRITKQEKGKWELIHQTPLAGEYRITCDSLHLKRHCIDYMLYIS